MATDLTDLQRTARPAPVWRVSSNGWRRPRPMPAAPRRSVPDVLTASASELHARLVDPRASRRCAPLVAACAAPRPSSRRFSSAIPTGSHGSSPTTLDAPRGAEEYARAPRGDVAPATPIDAAAALRRFKYYELARITVRDLWAAPGDVADHRARCSRELSHLADALLAAALELRRRARRRRAGRAALAARRRRPTSRRASRCSAWASSAARSSTTRPTSISSTCSRARPRPSTLGGGPSGVSPPSTSPASAREFARLVTETTGDGFLYRIDLDLRPEGQSRPARRAERRCWPSYYDAWAATWEKAAFMKARPVAGDLEFGWRVDPRHRSDDLSLGDGLRRRRRHPRR